MITAIYSRNRSDESSVSRSGLAGSHSSFDITDITSREARALHVGPALDQLSRFALCPRQRDAWALCSAVKRRAGNRRTELQ
jgi:hypothetical protein